MSKNDSFLILIPESYFSEILIKFISDLSVNLNVLNEDIRTKTENMI